MGTDLPVAIRLHGHHGRLSVRVALESNPQNRERFNLRSRFKVKSVECSRSYYFLLCRNNKIDDVKLERYQRFKREEVHGSYCPNPMIGPSVCTHNTKRQPNRRRAHPASHFCAFLTSQEPTVRFVARALDLSPDLSTLMRSFTFYELNGAPFQSHVAEPLGTHLVESSIWMSPRAQFDSSVARRARTGGAWASCVVPDPL